MNLLTLHKYLRLSPFDTTSEQGRSDERYRLAVLSMAANVLSRGVSMVVMVLTVSLTIPYLGAERFGAWMTITSLVGMLTFLDLGVGNALTNKVAQAAAQGNLDALRRTISGGLGFLFMLGCGMGFALIVLASVLPWQQLIKADNPFLHEEIRRAAMLFAGLFGVHIFANGVQRIFAGLQRAFEGHLVSAIGSITTLLVLWVAVRQEYGIPMLLALTMGIQSISSLVLIVFLFKRRQLYFKQLISNIREESPHLIHVGGLFFMLQIGVMVGWGADSLIISSNLGAEQVAIFAIVQRMFQLATQPMSMLNAPLWGAYADAHARGDKEFIRKTLARSLLLTSSYAIAVAATLLAFGEQIVIAWTGNSIKFSFGLLLAYGCWAVLEAVGNAFAMFLNGCNIVHPQVVAVCTLCAISIPLKFWLIWNYGIEAMLSGFALTYFAVFILFYGFVFRPNLKRNLI